MTETIDDAASSLCRGRHQIIFVFRRQAPEQDPPDREPVSTTDVGIDRSDCRLYSHLLVGPGGLGAPKLATKAIGIDDQSARMLSEMVIVP